MTARFVILAEGPDAQRRAVATTITRETRLPIVAELPKALVVADQAIRLGGPGAPIAIGRLFTHEGEDCALASASCLDRLQAPEAIVANAWGGYLILFDDGERGFRLMRDPSGTQPCYYRRAADKLVVASDLQLLDIATEPSRDLDWIEIARLLVETDLRGPKTALANTSELMPGVLLTVRGNAMDISQCWSPWDHARHRQDVTAGEPEAGLRQRVSTVIAALARPHDRAMATISGGLDSSIVALTLASHTDLTCLTMATLDPSGDERRYARLVAEAAASVYQEHFLDAGALDLRRSQASHLPRPIGRPFLMPMIQAFEQGLRTTGATAVFNGTGGDNVFCFLQSATPAADRLRSEGVIAAAATVGDIAKLTGASFPQVAAAAIRRAMQGKLLRPWRRDRRFVTADIAAATPGFAHPWLQAPDDARLGTEAHVVMLLRIQNYMDAWAADWPADVVNPLLAQPIVEYCLGIPSWHWCRDGLDRAVARRAFADRLPSAIMNRTWKGGPDGFIADVVDRNRAAIREILLDGILAGHGLIDRAAVAEALDDRRPLATVDAPRLLLLTDAEAWVHAHG